MDDKILLNTKKDLTTQKTEDGKEVFTKEKKEKLAKAAKDFESLMTQQMLKAMRESKNSLFEDEEEGKGMGEDVYDSMFDSQLSQMMSKDRGFGIAESIYKNVTGEDLDPELLKKRVRASSFSPVGMKMADNFAAITPSRSSLERLEKYEATINKYAEQFGVKPELVKSIILAESAANPKAVSGAKAKGLMQLMDSTARDMGVRNPFNPNENIMGGTRYIGEMLQRYDGDLQLALAAYNAGPGNVDKHNGIPPFTETRQYVTRVMGYYKQFEENGKAAGN